MKIYTKTGDLGETSLIGGQRVTKSDLRLEAYGTVDELNSVIGMVIAEMDRAAQLEPQAGLTEPKQALLMIQNELFNLGSQLACETAEMRDKLPKIEEHHILQLEHWMDSYTTELTPLKNFILPGGPVAAAQCHLARTICRRAERATVRLGHNGLGDSETLASYAVDIRFLNRLSDYLFVLARLLTRRLGGADITWSARKAKDEKSNESNLNSQKKAPK